MMDELPMLGGVATAVLVAAGLWPLIHYLRKRAILDHPGERSSHSIPTPRGAGLVIIPAVAIVLLALTGADQDTAMASFAQVMAIAAIGLCLVSWIDDLRHLSPLLRLGAHFVCALAGIWALGPDILILQGLVPLAVDRILAVVAWVWFINLFNFMDGIDGISVVETAVCAFGAIVIASLAHLSTDIVLTAAVLLGAVAGFTPWNWHPAKVFLGDSGSAPLGYLVGGLLIMLAASGELAAAIILPLYYLTDASVTIARRALRGEKVWIAHREHWYQRAASGGLNHAKVSLSVLAGGVALVGCAAIASHFSVFIGFIAASLVTGLLILFFSRHAKSAEPRTAQRN